jgi:hypothetical protein
MNDGQISIVPEATRNKDIVCILRDASSLCVLRQDPEGHWMLVSGDCFIFQSKYCQKEDSSFEVAEYLKDNGDSLEEFKIR